MLRIITPENGWPVGTAPTGVYRQRHTATGTSPSHLDLPRKGSTNMTTTNSTSTLQPNPFDEIIHTTAEGFVTWKGRDLYPLLGCQAWEDFTLLILRARQLADNIGLRCYFKETRVNVEGDRRDWILDRNAATMVAWTADPTHPKVAEAQAYFCRPTEPHSLAQEVTNLIHGLTTLAEHAAKAPSPAVEKAGTGAVSMLKRASSLSQWRRDWLPYIRRNRLFEALVEAGALEVVKTRPTASGYHTHVYKVTHLGARHGLQDAHHVVKVVPGREEDLAEFVKSLGYW